MFSDHFQIPSNKPFKAHKHQISRSPNGKHAYQLSLWATHGQGLLDTVERYNVLFLLLEGVHYQQKEIQNGKMD